jgi:hypothetical protein
VQLYAQVTSASEAEMLVEVELHWDSKPRAAANARWRRWRPR